MNCFGWMDNDSVARRETGAHFGGDAIVVSDFDFAQQRFAIFDGERHPIAATPEECAARHLDNIITVPGDDSCLYTVSIAEFSVGGHLI